MVFRSAVFCAHVHFKQLNPNFCALVVRPLALKRKRLRTSVAIATAAAGHLWQAAARLAYTAFVVALVFNVPRARKGYELCALWLMRRAL